MKKYVFIAERGKGEERENINDENHSWMGCLPLALSRGSSLRPPPTPILTRNPTVASWFTDGRPTTEPKSCRVVSTACSSVLHLPTALPSSSCPLPPTHTHTRIHQIRPFCHQVPASLRPRLLTPPRFQGCSLPPWSTFLSGPPDTTLASAPPLPPPRWPPPGLQTPPLRGQHPAPALWEVLMLSGGPPLWRLDQEMPTLGRQPRIPPRPSSSAQALPRLRADTALTGIPASVQTAATGDGGTSSDPVSPRPEPHLRPLPELRRALMPPLIPSSPPPPAQEHQPPHRLSLPSPGPPLWGLQQPCPDTDGAPSLTSFRFKCQCQRP